MKVKSIKDAAKKKATKTEKVEIEKVAKKVDMSSGNMKTQNAKDVTKKKAIKPGKTQDICELAVKTEEDTKKMMLQDIMDIAKKMGIDAGDLNRTELVRAIQRAEGTGTPDDLLETLGRMKSEGTNLDDYSVMVINTEKYPSMTKSAREFLRDSGE